MDLPSYSEFIPNLVEAENALENILSREDEVHREFSYNLDDGVLSARWDNDSINEIAVYHLASSDQLMLEGHSRREDRFASTHFGVTHVSTLEPNLEAQYGMIIGLEDCDYSFRPNSLI